MTETSAIDPWMYSVGVAVAVGAMLFILWKIMKGRR